MSSQTNSYALDLRDRIAIVLEDGQKAKSGAMQRCIESLGGVGVSRNIYIVNASHYSPQGVAEALTSGIADGETIVLLFEHKGKLGSRLLVNDVEHRQEGIIPD